MNLRMHSKPFLLVLIGFFWPAGLAQESIEEAVVLTRQLYFARDFKGGAREGERLLARFPNARELQAWYLLNLARSGGTKAAVAAAEKMVSEAKESPWSWFALADSLNWIRHRGEEALAASEKVYALLPNHPDALWLRAATLERQKKSAEAVDFVEQHRAKVRNPAELLNSKANALYSLYTSTKPRDEAKFAEMLTVFEEARQLEPTNVNAHYLPGVYLAGMRRNADAYPLLAKASSLAPNSVDIQGRLWSVIMGLPDRPAEEKRAEVEREMARLLERRGNYSDALSKVASYAREFELGEKVMEAEEKLLALFPSSAEAEWVFVNRYRELRDRLGAEGEKDPEKSKEYRRLLREFIRRPHHHQETLLGDAYRSLFYSIKEDPSVSPEELLEVVQGMVRYEGINPHTVFAGGAIALAERKIYFREAEQIARAGLDEGKRKIDSQRPAYETEGDYQKALNWMTALMYDALGWVYFQEGRVEEGEKELLRAYELYHENRNNLFHLGQVYRTRGNLDKEEDFYIKGLAVESPGDNPCEKALRDLYQRRQGSLEGFDEYRSAIGDMDRKRRKERILAERLAQPETAPPFLLKDINGREVSLDDLKGKIVVINFWGTWCGPCVAEMPEFQKLSAQYQKDPDVAILTINNDADPHSVAPLDAEKGLHLCGTHRRRLRSQSRSAHLSYDLVPGHQGSQSVY